MHVEKPFTTADCKLGGEYRALAGLLGGVSDPKRTFVSNRSNIWTRSSNAMGGIGEVLQVTDFVMFLAETPLRLFHRPGCIRQESGFVMSRAFFVHSWLFPQEF